MAFTSPSVIPFSRIASQQSPFQKQEVHSALGKGEAPCLNWKGILSGSLDRVKDSPHTEAFSMIAMQQD